MSIENTEIEEKEAFDIEAFYTSSEEIAPQAPVAPVMPKTGGERQPITADMPIVDDAGNSYTAQQLLQLATPGQKLTVHCPFPGHEDNNPSAFAAKVKSGDLFISCSACQQKGYYKAEAASTADEVAITVETIDKAAIKLEIGAEEKTMRGAMTDILTALPEIICKEPDDLKPAHFVRNIRRNCLYPLSNIEGQLRVFYSGYWQGFPSMGHQRNFIISLIEKSAGKDLDVVKLLADNVLQELMERGFEKNEEHDQKIMINLLSNVLEIKNGEFYLLPQDEKYGFLYKLPYDFDPDIDTTHISDFFLESVEEKEALDVLFEFIGSAFIPNSLINMEKILVLHGSGSNGKSVILDLIKQTLGDDSVSTLELQQFSNDNKIQITIGKLLNIGTEIDAKRIDPSLVKRLASAEPVTVDKKYGDSFTLKTFPKMIFATNNLPANSSDTSAGYFRRFLLLSFNKQFNHTKKEKNFMPNLLSHRPAILKLILEGTARLNANGEFTVSRKIADAGRKFETFVDSIRGFINDCEVEAPKPTGNQKFTSNPTLYKAYETYCFQEGIQPKTKREFINALKSQGFGVYKSGNDRGLKAIISTPPEGCRGYISSVPELSPKSHIFGASHKHLKESAHA